MRQMISLWILYSTAVALLLALGALAGERVLLATRHATRWIWVAAVVGSLVLPIVFARAAPVGSGRGSVESGILAGEPARRSAVSLAAVPLAAIPASSPFERALGFGWLLASGCLAGAVLLSARSLERRRRTWRHRVLAGSSVWVAGNLGPAVVGFLWTEVVVPKWVLRWDDESLRLLVEHEREHERAGDPCLLLLAMLAVILLPWNPAVWWQARRLRLAVEVDCDARVLRSHGSARTYGQLLLEVGRISSGTLVPVAPFSRSRSLLERRIHLLGGADRLPRPVLRSLCAAVLLAPAAAVTLPAPRPPDLDRLWVSPHEAAREARFSPDPRGPQTGDPNAHLAGRPIYTPYEVRPELLNPNELQRAIAGTISAPGNREIHRTAVLWAFVDARGTVTRTRVASSSGDPVADRVLMEEVRRTAHFAAAREDDRRVSAWIQLPIALDPAAPVERSYRLPIATMPPPPLPAGGAALADPTAAMLTPGVPQLRDGRALAERLAVGTGPGRPPATAQRSPVLLAYVDETGVVTHTRLSTSSGNHTLDLAAREAVAQAHFHPARRDGRPVATWVRLPVPLPR